MKQTNLFKFQLNYAQTIKSSRPGWNHTCQVKKNLGVLIMAICRKSSKGNPFSSSVTWVTLRLDNNHECCVSTVNENQFKIQVIYFQIIPFSFIVWHEIFDWYLVLFLGDYWGIFRGDFRDDFWTIFWFDIFWFFGLFWHFLKLLQLTDLQNWGSFDLVSPRT